MVQLDRGVGQDHVFAAGEFVLVAVLVGERDWDFGHVFVHVVVLEYIVVLVLGVDIRLIDVVDVQLMLLIVVIG